MKQFLLEEIIKPKERLEAMEKARRGKVSCKNETLTTQRTWESLTMCAGLQGVSVFTFRYSFFAWKMIFLHWQETESYRILEKKVETTIINTRVTTQNENKLYRISNRILEMGIDEQCP